MQASAHTLPLFLSSRRSIRPPRVGPRLVAAVRANDAGNQSVEVYHPYPQMADPYSAYVAGNQRLSVVPCWLAVNHSEGNPMKLACLSPRAWTLP